MSKSIDLIEKMSMSFPMNLDSFTTSLIPSNKTTNKSDFKGFLLETLFNYHINQYPITQVDLTRVPIKEGCQIQRSQFGFEIQTPYCSGEVDSFFKYNGDHYLVEVKSSADEKGIVQILKNISLIRTATEIPTKPIIKVLAAPTQRDEVKDVIKMCRERNVFFLQLGEKEQFYEFVDRMYKKVQN